eukprot:3504029-Pyramimonas_sp.AAC.1
MRRGDIVERIHIACPPAVLGSTKARDLQHAVSKRIPSTIDDLRAKCGGRLRIVLSSDSGPACLTFELSPPFA